MLTLNKYIFLLVSLFLSSCGFFSSRVESLVEKTESQKNFQIKSPKKNLFCSNNASTQILVEDESTLKFYTPLFPLFLNNNKLSFVQKSVALTLLEMIRRPDAVSPTARLQFYMRLNGKDSYFDFTSKDSGSMPLLTGVEYLLQNFDSSKKLATLAEMLDSSVPSLINVSSEFENFLQDNQNEISKNEELLEYFFKGDEILTRHESFKRESFKKLIQVYYSTLKASKYRYDINKLQLQEVKTQSQNLQLLCNIDITKDSQYKDDLKLSAKNNSHYFALMEDDNFFIAVSSYILPEKKISNIKGTYFINTESTQAPLPVCQYKTKFQDSVLFSTQGRFPTQHLKHLVNYDISLVTNQDNLKELLSFSRHLFLSNPYRILYESKRGRKSQLDFFLSMNFPIYHVNSIGDIIGASKFNTPSKSSKSLIVDDRSSAKLWCKP